MGVPVLQRVELAYTICANPCLSGIGIFLHTISLPCFSAWRIIIMQGGGKILIYNTLCITLLARGRNGMILLINGFL